MAHSLRSKNQNQYRKKRDLLKRLLGVHLILLYWKVLKTSSLRFIHLGVLIVKRQVKTLRSWPSISVA
uniref:Pdi5 n=1 Tax=Arundo donax TaxID=35708 RepID=A0A0A9H9M8_ARUDO